MNRRFLKKATFLGFYFFLFLFFGGILFFSGRTYMELLKKNIVEESSCIGSNKQNKTVIIKYEDALGNKIAEDEVILNNEEINCDINKKNIPNYVLVKVEEKIGKQYGNQTQILVCVYVKAII